MAANARAPVVSSARFGQRGGKFMFTRPMLVAAAAGLWGTGAAATEVAVCTDNGRFVIELADELAPMHVENFLRYVDMGFYAGTVFHRVVKGFVVQAGGVDKDLRGRPTLPPVENESRNGLSNVRGTVAAARAQDPHSATSQFFVNLEDNTQLDAGEDFGYTVFGRIKEGIAVLDRMADLPTTARGPFASDVPDPLPQILSMARLDADAVGALPEENREATLKREITAAAAAGEYETALRRIDVYRAICGAQDPEIGVVEAEAALATNGRRRAVFALENYFASADPAHPTYERAVALYRAAVPENQQSASQPIDGCDEPQAPQVPDGSKATMEEMIAGQTAVREFVADGELYLACLAEVIDDEEKPTEQRNAAIAAHNRMVTAMEETAERFNGEIRRFRNR
jgi:peptidyl-prolyl cis-trans isomerase A (cyclophilin A)